LPKIFGPKENCWVEMGQKKKKRVKKKKDPPSATKITRGDPGGGSSRHVGKMILRMLVKGT